MATVYIVTYEVKILDEDSDRTILSACTDIDKAIEEIWLDSDKANTLEFIKESLETQNFYDCPKSCYKYQIFVRNLK